MMTWLWAQDAATRTVFEWGRIQSPEDWFLPLGVFALFAVFVAVMNVFDGVDLSRRGVVFLATLRLLALVALLIAYLQPQWREEQQVVENSRALVLVDTSQSMGLVDESPEAADGQSRLAQVTEFLQDSSLLNTLRERHDLQIYGFGNELRRLGTLPKLGSETAEERDDETGAEQPTPEAPATSNWAEELLPTAGETRLGEAVAQALRQNRAAPLSGLLLFSDGGQNAGPGEEWALQAATETGVPLFTVGLGSTQPFREARIADVARPERIYPGDDFSVTVYLQASGLEGRSITVRLQVADAAGTAEAATDWQDIATRQVELPADGEPLSVALRGAGFPEAGRRTLRVILEGDRGTAQADETEFAFDVVVVERASRILLFAGGPTREYRFLRNQLHRDPHVTLDVLLQTAKPGISQDASEVLFDFPATREELFEYDAIVAFDPDWRQLDDTQIQILEEWIAEQAGGLIAVAGPVYMDRWTRDARMAAIRALYPVKFYRRFSRLEDGHYGSPVPLPVQFTRAGQEAEMLRLDDTAVGNQQAWQDFPGVYGYYLLEGTKETATVHARLGGTAALRDEERPVFLAEHLYGAGRVFFLGTGELWRTRALDPGYFEKFYVKLLRHVSQGRLLRGSQRGLLLVERDRLDVGETTTIRAQLSDRNFQPLERTQIVVDILRPDRSWDSLTLRPDPSRPGMYSGQLLMLREGAYELALELPEEDVRITRRLRAVVPDVERRQARLNDTLLRTLAQQSGGEYYHGVAAVGDPEHERPLALQLRDMRRQTYLAGVPDRQREQDLAQWLLVAACGLLCVEWLTRRLWRLA